MKIPFDDDTEWPIVAVHAVTMDPAQKDILHALPSALITHLFFQTMCGVMPVDPVDGDDDTDLARAVAWMPRFADVDQARACPECAKLFRNIRATLRGPWDGGNL